VLGHRVGGPRAQVAVTSVRPLLVTGVQPDIEIYLQYVQALVESGAQLHPEELTLHRAVEPLGEAVRARAPHLRAAELDLSQRQEPPISRFDPRGIRVSNEVCPETDQTRAYKELSSISPL
jgi:hypothetical protein